MYLIVLLLFTVPAWAILSKKNRGIAYYILSLVFPIPGLIVALCLKNMKSNKKSEVLNVKNSIQCNSQDTHLISQTSGLENNSSTQSFSDKPRNVSKGGWKNRWPIVFCSFLVVITVAIKIYQECNKHELSSSAKDVRKEDNFNDKDYLTNQRSGYESVGLFSVPEDWSEYKIDEAMTLAVPNTMELRKDYDDYTVWISDNLGILNSAVAVFQQRNLSTMSRDAYQTYARVLIQHCPLSPADVGHYYEYPELTTDDRLFLKELVDEELGPYNYVDTPTWRWIDINGTKAIEGSYRRNGDEGPVNCKYYLLSNYDEIVKILITFRERDRDRWEQDLNNIIKTFKWDSLK